MKAKVIAYFKDETGQTSTEYILLVAVVAMVVMKFKDKLQEKLLDGNDSVLNKAFNTDRLFRGLDN
jgi:pilus assembly protein Flp/PilA